MRQEYSDTIKMGHSKSGQSLAARNVIHNRRSVELIDKDTSGDMTVMKLRYTQHAEREKLVNEIIIKGDSDTVTIEAAVECEGKAPGVKVGFKSTARNIRSTLANHSAKYSGSTVTG